MSQQALDLRSSLQNVWRQRKIAVYVAALGLIAGVAFALLNPPMLVSEALVALQPQPLRDIRTQVVVAGSDAVLVRANRHIDPAVSLGTLHSRVRVSSVTPDILEIDAQGTTVAQATDTANAVANAYIAYIGPPNIPDAWVLESATTATGNPLSIHLLDNAGLGALLGIMAGAIVALAVGRNDRRLRGRDEIAGAAGVPVLASISVSHPANVAGWRRLVERYEPSAADEWSLRRVLHELGVTSAGGGWGTSVAVISLSSDRRALALGPQLAAFAASLGIVTALTIDERPDAKVKATATLRAACAVTPSISSGRSGNLLAIASHQEDIGLQPGPALTVVVAVVDGQAPRVAETMRTTTTVLGVSAGAARPEQLARVAVSVGNDDRDVAGIIVADPDPADRTTGRFPQPGRRALRTLPTRVPGMAAEARP